MLGVRSMRLARLLLLPSLLTCRTVPMPTTPELPLPAIEARFQAWEAAGPTGDAAHRARLDQLAKVVRGAGPSPRLVFVCTHNSRRSHLAQLLGLVAARRAGSQATTFSAGTEATAFNPRAIAALRRAGFELTSADEPNPRVRVRWSGAAPEVVAFSKTLEHESLPREGFIAVMTCSQADAACPLVTGALARVSVPYEDPKVADGTPDEARVYDERVEQLGRDLAWVFRQAAR